MILLELLLELERFVVTLLVLFHPLLAGLPEFATPVPVWLAVAFPVPGTVSSAMLSRDSKIG